MQRNGFKPEIMVVMKHDFIESAEGNRDLILGTDILFQDSALHVYRLFCQFPLGDYFSLQGMQGIQHPHGKSGTGTQT
jgi:hypothetical protein